VRRHQAPAGIVISFKDSKASSMPFDRGMGIAEKIVYKQLFTSLLGRRVCVDLPDVGAFF
jgi:hypothetical protein